MFGPDIDDVLMSGLSGKPEEVVDSFVPNPIPEVAQPLSWDDHEVEYNIFGKDWNRHSHFSIDLGLSTPGKKSWRLFYTLKKLGEDSVSYYDLHDEGVFFH